MGEISEMLMEGTLCYGCGVSLFGEYRDWEIPDYPVFCPGCNPRDYGFKRSKYNHPVHLKMTPEEADAEFDRLTMEQEKRRLNEKTY